MIANEAHPLVEALAVHLRKFALPNEAWSAFSELIRHLNATTAERDQLKGLLRGVHIKTFDVTGSTHSVNFNSCGMCLSAWHCDKPERHMPGCVLAIKGKT